MSVHGTITRGITLLAIERERWIDEYTAEIVQASDIKITVPFFDIVISDSGGSVKERLHYMRDIPSLRGIYLNVMGMKFRVRRNYEHLGNRYTGDADMHNRPWWHEYHLIEDCFGTPSNENPETVTMVCKCGEMGVGADVETAEAELTKHLQTMVRPGIKGVLSRRSPSWLKGLVNAE